MKLPNRWADLGNVYLIGLGWAALHWLLPPEHEYPIIDDWIYAGSVQTLLNTGHFVMPDQSQANLVGLTYWGAAWVQLFGFSYTTLTYSTLALALGGLLAFYGLARTVQVPAAGALLGTALLALNPLFLHLSASFMTDVPFLALVLIACYGYTRGLSGGGKIPAEVWLAGAGLIAAAAFLIRQFGVLVPLGFGAYLVLDGLWTGRWRWRHLIALGLAPALVGLGWWWTTRAWPPTGATLSANGWRAEFLFKPAWLEVFLLRTLYILPPLALSAGAALVGRWPPSRRLWGLLIGSGLAVIGGLAWSGTLATQWIGITEPPFIGQWGPLTWTLPRQAFIFGGDGNIVRVEGINFYQYRQQALWTPEAWWALWAAGSLLGAGLVARLAAGVWNGLAACRAGATLPPVVGNYFVGLATFGVTLALSGYFYDRYLLGVLPFVLLFLLRASPRWGRGAWGVACTGLVVLGLFGILLRADAIDHDNARWQAGNWLLARGVAPMVGLDWQYVRPSNDPHYEVADLPISGFRVEAQFPYTSRLSGFTTRYVLAQVQADQPPLNPSLP